MLLWITAFYPVQANDRYLFSPITTLNGLSDNGVRSLSQLHDGRMVVVTEGLVHLYDGYHFQYMHYDESKAYPLTGYTGFHHVYTDDEAHLWIKNSGKLMLFDLSTERFVSDLTSYWKSTGVTEQVADFFVDAQKGIWLLLTTDKLLYRKNGTDRFFAFASNVSTDGTGKDVLYDLVVTKDQLFLFYQSGLIRCLSLKSKAENFRTSAFPHTKNPYTLTLMVVPFGQYLYQVRNRATGGLLNRYNTQKRSWETLMQTPYCLNTLTIDNVGNCWMSSRVGLWKINQKTGNKQLISPLHLVNGKALETEISAQYTDIQGGLWVGTFNQGLLYYHPDKALFKRIDRIAFQPTAPSINVRCFAENNRQLLVGTDNGLYQYREATSSLIRVVEVPASSVCNALFRDRQKRIWLCTESSGLYVFSGGKTTHYPLTVSCRNIAQSRSGILYLCTNRGFARFNPDHGTLQALTAIDRAGLGAVTQLIAFGKQQLLGFSAKGLFLYDELRQTLEFPTTGNQPLFRHPNQQYLCLFEDKQGRVWFGTQDGLNVFDPKTKKSRVLHREDGLMGNNIFGIAEDRQGNVWVSTTNGMSCIESNSNQSLDGLFFTNYDRSDGIMENAFNPRAICITLGQQLVCGGQDGFNTMTLNAPARQQNPNQKSLFTRLLISGREIKTGVSYDGTILLPRALASTDKIVLKSRQNTLVLECSGLNFVHPDQTYYRYTLEGFEHEWHLQKASEGFARIAYSNLKSGRYTLRIVASNNLQHWNLPEQKLTLIVKPAWWGTPLAFVLYLLMLLFIVGGTVFSRKRKQKSEASKQAASNPTTSFDSFLKTPNLSGPDEVFLQKVLNCIEQNLSNASYSVEQLSKELGMDRTNLYRKLSALAGMTPSDFIRSIRLKRAAQLLKKGFRVSEVTTQVGFNSTSYFSKCFQETYGVAPSQYKTCQTPDVTNDANMS